MTKSKLDLEKIGQRFGLFRALIRESRESLAVVLCVDVSVLEKLEAGCQTCLISVCKRVFEEYGVSPNWILTGGGQMFKTWTKRTPLDAFTAANFSDVEDPNFATIAKMVHCMFADPVCKDFILQRYLEFTEENRDQLNVREEQEGGDDEQPNEPG